MTDHSLLTEDHATSQIAERLRRAERSRVPGLRRPRGRHALAERLHRVADRLDA
jgi:hypothetical protein